MHCTPGDRGQSQVAKSHPNLVWFCSVTAVVLAAVVLRIWGLSFESLDGDEVFSYRVASSHLSAAIAAIRDDLVHPPLYYFLLRAALCIAGCASPLLIRAVSLASGIAVIALVGSLGLVFLEIRTAAFIAACLLAANNLHIYYSQQARSYAWYTLLFTCLLVWCWHSGRFAGRFRFLVGSLLMSLLVYTHYVGAVYIACLVVAITLSPVSRRAKFQVWAAGFFAACTFVPWILAELGPARRHPGVEHNLSWESLPTAYDLKAIWANYLGIPAFHGATTGVLLIGCALITFGVFYRRAENTPFRRVFLTTLVITAFVPPCFLFLLSVRPFSLPLFGARHLLPSMISYTLLVADGLVQLSKLLRPRIAGLVLGSAALVALELTPTMSAMTSEPRRMPFREIVAATGASLPLYTTWHYGIAGPMNFYERGAGVVQEVPSDSHDLPENFLMIFRPVMPREEEKFEELLRAGWRDVGHRDFYNGSHAKYYVRVADLQHPAQY